MKTKTIFTVLLGTLLVMMMCMSPFSVSSENMDFRDAAPFQPNTVEQPTLEQLEKAQAKLEKCNQYVALKNAGNYSEALAVLKEIWPHSQTTVQNIQSTANTGEVIVPVDRFPLETQAPAEVGLRSQRQTVNVTHYPQTMSIK